MKITKRTLYAIRALVVIAKSGEISINEISEKTKISRKFLEQIFIDLKKAKIITSKRGIYGGYKIAKKPENISIHDIMQSVGEEIEIAPCLNEEDCATPCEAKDVLVTTHKKFLEYTENVTLKDMINKGGDNIDY
jgi:Rrf2 family iron-sulfur cluster assembly transcriptional regulator